MSELNPLLSHPQSAISSINAVEAPVLTADSIGEVISFLREYQQSMDKEIASAGSFVLNAGSIATDKLNMVTCMGNLQSLKARYDIQKEGLQKSLTGKWKFSLTTIAGLCHLIAIFIAAVKQDEDANYKDVMGAVVAWSVPLMALIHSLVESRALAELMTRTQALIVASNDHLKFIEYGQRILRSIPRNRSLALAQRQASAETPLPTSPLSRLDVIVDGDNAFSDNMGDGVANDSKIARAYLHYEANELDLALEACQHVNSSSAQCLMGLIFYTRGAVHESMRHFREAASQQHPYALFMMGRFYFTGEIQCTNSFQIAMKYYEQAGDANCGIALRSLGKMYELGIGVEFDLDKAKTFYDTAHNGGDTLASLDLVQLSCPESLWKRDLFQRSPRVVGVNTTEYVSIFSQVQQCLMSVYLLGQHSILSVVKTKACEQFTFLLQECFSILDKVLEGSDVSEQLNNVSVRVELLQLEEGRY